MINTFQVALSIDVNESSVINWKKFLGSTNRYPCEIEADGNAYGVYVDIDGKFCRKDWSLPRDLEEFLINAKKLNNIIRMVCCYTFEHDGQCNLEFHSDFLQSANLLFDSFCITTYRGEDDEEDEEL